MKVFVEMRPCGDGKAVEYMRERNIILASQSPRRRELLSEILDSYIIEPSRCPEDAVGTPERVVLQQGYDKALDVFMRHPDAIVIGADSVVAIDGMILGKPVDDDDARRMLHMLSGRRHSVLTGMCVVGPEGCATALDETYVYDRSIPDEEIEAYIRTGEGRDKAGAYGIQGKGGSFVTRYEGDFDNVIGLCVKSLEDILTRKFDVKLKPRVRTWQWKQK